MKKILLTSILVLAAGLACSYQNTSQAENAGDEKAKTETSTATAPAPKVDHYTCPMHTHIREDKAGGKCPICNMDLEPVFTKSK
ncbi:MAG: hypothetical protein ACD_73C00662G0001 [uncultured bacterium]|nr:MAG: hypothetical protein ACD_73C00662G0001 [uncultured bacterium]